MSYANFLQSQIINAPVKEKAGQTPCFEDPWKPELRCSLPMRGWRRFGRRWPSRDLDPDLDLHLDLDLDLDLCF